GGGGGISNYIADGGKDLQTLEKLLKSQKNFCDYDDILALFWLQQVELPSLLKLDEPTKNEPTEPTEETAQLTALSEKLPQLISTIKTPNHTQQLFHKNVETLRNYKYNTINLESTAYQPKVIISLENSHFLELSEEGLFIFDNLPQPKWDYTKFIENGYTCGINHIYQALESWATYFERGRRKCTEPFVLTFANIGDFEQSLYFIDYADILDNENYVIALQNKPLPIFADYQPKVDAGFLFEERTRILKIMSGTGDQISNLYFHMQLCEENGLELFVDDFHFDWWYIFEGITAHKIALPQVNERRFSQRFSPRLRWALYNFKLPHGKGPHYHLTPFEQYFYLGLKELYIISMTSIVGGMQGLKDGVYERVKIISGGIVMMPADIEQHKDLIANKMPKKTLAIHCNYMYDSYVSKESFEKYTIFPKISEEDTNNYKVAQLAKTSDLIAIHVRRGDRVVGYFYSKDHDELDYKKGIDILQTHEFFAKYKNKHLLVFSDDMDFCRKNAEKFSFNIFGENITYVDWNHHFDSYKDLQLISMCKVIIRGAGRFALTAWHMGKSCEYLVEIMNKTITNKNGEITKI
ncbi:MAG: alpha-1,2-fucosyltransferase, partial [Defluviitaleaceae bacterium]|nr:alpha-1,2-fucosyltransferase [Defluviitaleaceae bacterium]